LLGGGIRPLVTLGHVVKKYSADFLVFWIFVCLVGAFWVVTLHGTKYSESIPKVCQTYSKSTRVIYWPVESIPKVFKKYSGLGGAKVTYSKSTRFFSCLFVHESIWSGGGKSSLVSWEACGHWVTPPFLFPF
jgi:hypothetical protein